jgi:PA14 domain
MKNRVRAILYAVLVLLPGALWATPAVSTPVVVPSTLVLGLATPVTVTCQVTEAQGDPAVLAGGVNLVRLTAAGGDSAVVGVMTAGTGGSYSYQLTDTETVVGQFQFQCAAAFTATIHRVRSTATTVTTVNSLAISSLLTVPALPVAGQQFSLTVSGAGINPANAQIVITGPGCAPCTIANAALTTKTATSVTGPVTLASSGAFTVAVQNGSGGTISTTLPLAVAPVPSVTSLLTTPTLPFAGEKFSFTIGGANFDPASAAVVINGPGCAPCTVANTTLTTKTAASLTGPATLASAGAFTFAVKNVATGAISGTEPLTVAPVPSLTSLLTTPTIALAGQKFTLTISGANFDPVSAAVVINGPGCAPCTITNATLTTKTALSLAGPVTLASAGSFTVAVQNVATGATSATLPLTVTPLPSLSSLKTTPIVALATEKFTFTLAGTNFDPASAEVVINGPSCTPCIIGNATLTTKTTTSLSGPATLGVGAFTFLVENVASLGTSGTLPLTVAQVPSLTSLLTTPTMPVAGHQFTFTLAGGNFDPASAEVLIIGPGCAPCVVANAALTTKTAASLVGAATVSSAGAFTFAVENAATGGISGSEPLTVAPAPSLTSILTTPASPYAGEKFSFTLAGANFDPASAAVVINGPGCAPCTIANATLTTKTAASLTGPATLGSAGAYTFAVQNVATGGTSGTLSFTIAAIPSLTSILTTPTSPYAGEMFSFTIAGANFDPASAAVVINGPGCAPCIVANTALTGKTAASLTGPATLSGAGAYTFAVQNVATGATSGTLPLTMAPVPSLTSLLTTPTLPVAGQKFTFTLAGANFDPASVEVLINGPGCAPCTVGNAALTTKTAASLVGPATLSSAGAFTFAVENVATGAVSGSRPLTVAPVPSLTSILTTPTAALGGQKFSFTIAGANFDPASALVIFNGPGCAPCNVTNAALTTKTAASLAGSASLGAGAFTVAVENVTTGATSGTLPFTVFPIPTVTGLLTAPVIPLAGQKFTLTVAGTNFDPASAGFVINGPGCAPCTVANSALTTKTATSIAGPVTLSSAGAFTVAVENVATLATSGTLPLTITPIPSLTTVLTTPTSALAGRQFTFTITGANFDPLSAEVLINGPGCTPCTIANTALTTKTAASLAGSTTINSAGAFTVAVENVATIATSPTLPLTVFPIPSLTSILTTPTVALAGEKFTFTIAGANFDPASAEVTINGPGCAPCVVANTALTVKTGALLTGPATIAPEGAYTVTVENLATLAISAGLPLTVAPVPTLTNLVTAPISPLDEQQFSFTLTGTKFDPASVEVVITGPGCAPCTVANAALTGKTATSVMGTTTLVTAGAFTVAVENLATLAISGTLPLTVEAAPYISGLSPAIGKAGATISVVVSGQYLTGATFAFRAIDPSYAGTPATVAVVTNTGTSATLTVGLGSTQGQFALIASNAFGSNLITPGSLFLIGPTNPAASFELSILNTAFNAGTNPLLPVGQNSASFEASVLNTDSPTGFPQLPTGLNSASFYVSVLNTSSSTGFPMLPAGQNSASYYISVCNTDSGCAYVPPALISANASQASTQVRTAVPSPGSPTAGLLPILEPLAHMTRVTVGQTIRLAAQNVDAGSIVEFDVNQAVITTVAEAPYETLFTVPDGPAELAFQIVVRAPGQAERVSQITRMAVVSDSGANIVGTAGRAGVEMSLAAGGLKAEFFHLAQPVTGLPSLDSIQPVRSGYATAIDEPNPGAVFGDDPLGVHLGSDYAVRFTGEVRADQPGQYRFWLTARSGATIRIDGKLLADPGFVTGEPSEAAVSLALDRGWHSIEVTYYLAVGASSVRLDWEQPGSARREVLGPEYLRTILGGMTAVSAADGTFVFPQVPRKFDSIWIRVKQGAGFIEYPAVTPGTGPVSIAVPK